MIFALQEGSLTDDFRLQVDLGASGLSLHLQPDAALRHVHPPRPQLLHQHPALLRGQQDHPEGGLPKALLHIQLQEPLLAGVVRVYDPEVGKAVMRPHCDFAPDRQRRVIKAQKGQRSDVNGTPLLSPKYNRSHFRSKSDMPWRSTKELHKEYT